MKKIIYFIEFIFVYIFFLFFKLLGYKISSNLGNSIGKLLGPMFRSKKLIVENLKKSNISLKKNYIEVASNILGNYGRIFSEYPFLKNFRNGELNNFIEINGKNYLENILKEKKRAVFVSGHFNNFELMAMQLEKSGIELSAIYRPLNNIFLNKIMEQIRTKYICKNQIKKGLGGLREVIKAFSKNTSVALMIDQRVSEGEKSTLFNMPTFTTTIPGQLVKKYNCPIVPIYIQRKNNIYFDITVENPIYFNEKDSIEGITLKLNNWLEKKILMNPDQWIWTHNKWKL